MSIAWQKSFGFNEVNLSGCAMEELDMDKETRISEISTRQQRTLKNCPKVGKFSFHPIGENSEVCTRCSFTFDILHFQKYSE